MKTKKKGHRLKFESKFSTKHKRKTFSLSSFDIFTGNNNYFNVNQGSQVKKPGIINSCKYEFLVEEKFLTGSGNHNVNLINVRSANFKRAKSNKTAYKSNFG